MVHVDDMGRRVAFRRAASAVAALFALLYTKQAVAQPADADAFTEALARGPLYAALVALVGGLLVSLTPCVYPMIAVTVSVFGATKARSRFQGAALSAVFVLGIAAMFTPLGVIAGMTGSMSGSMLQNRWVMTAIALLFLAMAVSLFGAFDLALPASLTNRLAQMGGIGYRGAFVLGLICGVIAAPCTGPVLTGILAWIAKTQNALLGGAAMAAFSLGLGAPFFVVGAFAVQLPKSGRWMVSVKSLLGLLMVVVALYFLGNAFPSVVRGISRSAVFVVTASLAVVVGLLLGAVQRDLAQSTWPGKLAKLVGVLLVSLGVFTLVTVWLKPTQSIAWLQVPVAEARARALAEKRPMLIDFTAAWCIACKELDKHTFSDRAVIDESERFIAVKVDATNDDEPEAAGAQRDYQVRGLPTVILVDSRGREAKRYTDFIPASTLLPALRAVD